LKVCFFQLGLPSRFLGISYFASGRLIRRNFLFISFDLNCKIKRNLNAFSGIFLTISLHYVCNMLWACCYCIAEFLLHPVMVFLYFTLLQYPFNAEPPRSALISSYVTPVDLFYKRNHGPIPVVDDIERLYSLILVLLPCLHFDIVHCRNNLSDSSAYVAEQILCFDSWFDRQP
jgi:hypothetical protein